jgi:hypothetical protein
MIGTRARLPVTALARRDAVTRRRPPTLASTVLALQRTAGNAATTRVLARDDKAKGTAQPPTKAAPPAPAFRLIVVDDGDTGLEAKTLEVALKIVGDELNRVTSKSTDDVVKSGFSIEHTKDKPEKWKPRDLGVRSFLVFLTQSKDEKHAVGLAAAHVDMTPEERKDQEKHFKAGVATEGGVNIQNLDRKRRSVSTSLVSTTVAIKMQNTKGAGPESAGALIGETILHEVGHDLGHVKGVGGHDHDEKGVMTVQRVLDTSLRYTASHFSEASEKTIRERLEELAKRRVPSP